jgi:hypothetical protein
MRVRSPTLLALCNWSITSDLLSLGKITEGPNTDALLGMTFNAFSISVFEELVDFKMGFEPIVVDAVFC